MQRATFKTPALTKVFLHLRGKAFSVSQLSVTLAVHFLDTGFITLSFLLSLSVFVMGEC